MPPSLPAAVERHTGRMKHFRPLQHHPRPEPYCMIAATMSLDLHERGIHAV
jgi:hypothetical protein